MKKFLKSSSLGFVLLALAVPVVAATDKPVVSSVSPTTVAVNEEETFSVTATDADGIDRCYFYSNAQRVGEMSVSGSTAYFNHTFTVAGQRDAYALCYDNGGKFGVGPVTTIYVDAGDADEANITMGTVLPDHATAGIPTEMRVEISSDNPIASCELIVPGGESMEMEINEADGEATAMYTFSVVGDSLVYALCHDEEGRFKASAFTTIQVAQGYSDIDSASPGTLVKLNCPADVYVNHPCTTVYYFGFDGKRHPFPNEKVYFSWYPNYDTLDLVSDGFMAALPIGERVTYKPGYVMVKFLTSPTVYFVDEAAELRAVASESVAYDFYGAAWNTMIHDISDAFYSDYSFGSTVENESDYSPTVASSNADIEDAW